MALIDIDEIKLQKEAYKFLSHSEKCNKYINEDIRAQIEFQSGKIEMGSSIHFSTDGGWHLHDLIVFCLKYSGPSDLYLVSYAVKEYQATIISKMKIDGLINNLYALLDYRVQVHDPSALQLIESVATSTGAIRTHAKLTVIKNKDWGIVITGSANLTSNTSNDVGVITCSHEVADYRIDWIKNKIKNGTKR